MTAPPAGQTGAPVTIGVDVGGTKMLGVVLGPDDTVMAERRIATPRHAAGLRLVLGELVARLASDAGGDSVAVGVGVPALVDRSGTLGFAPNLPAVTGLALDVAAVDNDATCAALGEWVLGAAAGTDDAVVVTLGTGIGGGIVAGGRLVRGAHGVAGEVGHMVVDPDGPDCPCGRRGCWERFASGPGLVRLAQAAATEGRLGSLAIPSGGVSDELTGESVTSAAADGNGEALAVLERFAWWVALGVANLVLALDPEVVVIGGGLAPSLTPVLDDIRRHTADQLASHTARAPARVEVAELGERSGAVGAALLARPGHRWA